MTVFTPPRTIVQGDDAPPDQWDLEVRDNLNYLHAFNVRQPTNQSGGALAVGDVVVFLTTADNQVTTSVVGGYSASDVGVVLATAIAAGAAGYVAVDGIVAVVNVNGPVTWFDPLQVSGIAKRARTGATGSFATALTTNASGNGTVIARLRSSGGGGGGGLSAHGHTAVDDGGVLADPKVTNSLRDTNNNEWAKVTTAASAVNEPNLGNAATGGAVVYGASGNDASVSVALDGKGTNGRVLARDALLEAVTVTTLTTVGPETYTAAQLLGALILRDPNGAARTDTLPTAALLVAAIQGASVGLALEFDIRNTADAAETITVAMGAGGTASGAMTIAQAGMQRFRVRLDNVTPASEAYTIYSLTQVTPAGGSAHVIQDEGSGLTGRSALNFVGVDVTATDDPGNDATIVTVTGGFARGLAFV